MSVGFRVEVLGAPPSWNQCYRIITIRGHGSMKKTSVAQSYQDDVIRLTRAARPSDFAPIGQLFICYQMFLFRNADADNILKIANDGLAKALEVNDSRFLPVVLSKTSGDRNPRLVISVLDAERCEVRVEQTRDRGIERPVGDP